MIRLDVGETKNDDGRSVYMDDSLYKMMGDWETDTKALEGRKALRSSTSSIGTDGGSKISAALEERVREDEGGYHRSTTTGAQPSRTWTTPGFQDRWPAMISGHKTNAIFDRYSIVERGRMIEASKRSEGVAREPRAEADSRGR